jgi:pimeloyl-ACP methyl ester carboxylesterase
MNSSGPAVEDQFVRVNGLTLAYRDWGDYNAPALLLLHAGGCHGHWWNEIAARFADRYHVIVPDLRGHGDSDRSEVGDYAFDTYASDIAALIATLALEDVRLVGHSLGGYVGLVYASRRPPQLIALVIADMLCELDQSALDRVHVASRKPSPTFPSREEAEARFRLQPPETVARPEILATLTAQAVVQTPDGQFGFKFDRRAMGHPPIRAWDFAPNVICPTLVVRGEWSSLMPREHAERLVTLLPNGQLHEVAGAYHHLMLDNPREFATALDNFLTRTRSAASGPTA